MKIQDVEIKTGLDRATIRFYEKENILTPERSENGYRNYSEVDVELLLKIKLLRKLGVNLPTIKALQQGSENLSEVLTQQIQILEQQIQNDTRAKAVCIQMQNDGVQYLTLDSELYLQELNVTRDKSSFQENIRKEIHPIRRFLARELDSVLISALMGVLLIMVFRVRMDSGLLSLLMRISIMVAMLPIEALMIHLLGTTPGKWLMGIRLEDPNGGKLSFVDAFTREWHVTFVGLGFYIPIYSQIRLWKAYCAETEGEGTYWDDEAEIHYRTQGFFNILGSITLVVLSLMLTYAATQDLELPTYRPKNLTMNKFVANYRYYNQHFGYDSIILDKDGNWTWDVDNGYISSGVSRQNLEYTYNERGGIQSISFDGGWSTDISSAETLYTVLYTVVASRPGVHTQDLEHLNELMETQFGEKLETGGLHSGSFQISDVVLDWEAELPAGEYIYINGMLFDFNNETPAGSVEGRPTEYYIKFTITIG